MPAGAFHGDPREAVPSQLYDQDFYAWSKAQADLLRGGRYSELDLEHLIAEVDDLGDALKRSVRNRLRTIVEHLLKLQDSPAQDPRPAWRATVRTQRVKLRDGLNATIRREVRAGLRNCMPTRGPWRRAHYAITASRQPPTPCR
ncbi:MAG TPA: DUF29 domain-containing protein [Geminicoccaceae bacterium]|nr:DUF29 domain-containing protein [Geminicoccaceae bacterium]